MRGCTILTIVLLYCSFQSEYQEKPDFLKLLAEHTYYLLPLVFDAALPAKVGAPLLVELADKAYFLAPMVAAFVMQFICSTGALTLPFMFHHSRVRRPLPCSPLLPRHAPFALHPARDAFYTSQHSRAGRSSCAGTCRNTGTGCDGQAHEAAGREGPRGHPRLGHVQVRPSPPAPRPPSVSCGPPTLASNTRGATATQRHRDTERCSPRPQPLTAPACRQGAVQDDLDPLVVPGTQRHDGGRGALQCRPWSHRRPTRVLVAIAVAFVRRAAINTCLIPPEGI